jgi:hypothetical protein
MFSYPKQPPNLIKKIPTLQGQLEIISRRSSENSRILSPFFRRVQSNPQSHDLSVSDFVWCSHTNFVLQRQPKVTKTSVPRLYLILLGAGKKNLKIQAASRGSIWCSFSPAANQRSLPSKVIFRFLLPAPSSIQKGSATTNLALIYQYGPNDIPDLNLLEQLLSRIDFKVLT